MPDIITSLVRASRLIDSPVGQLRIDGDGATIIRVAWPEMNATLPLLPSDSVCDHAATQLVAYFAGTLTAFDLPLTVHATPFVQRVCAAMRRIPHGETRTYGDLARDLDSHPRAVGGACGRNPIPVIIPCHRVMGSNARLTGFSGGAGIDTKQRLLDLETPEPRLF